MKEIIFDERNSEKKQLNKKMIHPYINEREIWYIKLGKNIWTEQDGKWEFMRPALVIKKIWNLFFWVPLTTGWKNSQWYFILPKSSFHDLDEQQKISRACLGHARTLDPKRFIEKKWIVWKTTFWEIKKLLAELYL